jgi:hypothetical protein
MMQEWKCWVGQSTVLMRPIECVLEVRERAGAESQKVECSDGK